MRDIRAAPMSKPTLTMGAFASWRVLGLGDSICGINSEEVPSLRPASQRTRNLPQGDRVTMTSPGPELWSSLQLAQRLLSNGQRREAFGIACKLAITDYERADWNDALGTLFTYCEDPERALRFFERAVDLMPTHPGYQYNLATAQRMLGFFPAAETTLDTVIALNPGDADAYYIRSDLRTQTPDKNHVRQLRHLLQSPLESAPKEIMLRFALGKELEDLERYDEAFQNFKRGCELERGRMRYSVSDDVATLDALIEYHDSSALSRHSSQESDKCIFVVGLPRTGTTLV